LFWLLHFFFFLMLMLMLMLLLLLWWLSMPSFWMWEFFGDLFMVSKQRWWGEELLRTQIPIFFWLLKFLSRNGNPEETRNPLEAFCVSTQTQTQTQTERGMKLVPQLC
jgi:hypothetical protein